MHTLPASDEYILSMHETEEGPKRRKRNQRGTKERRKRDQRETKERRKRDERETKEGPKRDERETKERRKRDERGTKGRPKGKRETKDDLKWMLCAGIDKLTWNPIQHA